MKLKVGDVIGPKYNYGGIDNYYFVIGFKGGVVHLLAIANPKRRYKVNYLVIGDVNWYYWEKKNIELKIRNK